MLNPELAVLCARNYRQLRKAGITIRKTVDCFIATIASKTTKNCCIATVVSTHSSSI